jgi:hypothetical protein
MRDMICTCGHSMMQHSPGEAKQQTKHSLSSGEKHVALQATEWLPCP